MWNNTHDTNYIVIGMSIEDEGIKIFPKILFQTQQNTTNTPTIANVCYTPSCDHRPQNKYILIT